MSSKDSAASAAAREAGNAAFRRRRLDEALARYTEALRLAPGRSEAWLKALGNRSAVAAELRDAPACARDVRRALHCLPDDDPEDAALGKLRERLLRRREECEKTGRPLGSPQEEVDPPAVHDSDALAGTGSSASLSSCVRVEWSEKSGRGLVARSALAAGSVVLTEAPLGLVSLADSAGTLCQACLRRLPRDPVPCEACAEPWALFCDEACRLAAQPFHELECGQLERLFNSGIAHLALRVLLALPLDRLRLFAEPEVAKLGVSNSASEQGDSVALAASLGSHWEAQGDESLALLGEAAKGIAGLLSKKAFLRSAGRSPEAVLGHKPSEDDEGQAEAFEVIVGSLERTMGRLICNAFAVRENRLEEGPEGLLTNRSAKIGSGLYPLAALLNHSCVPNVFTQWLPGGRLVVRVVREVAAGEELLNCYGPKLGQMMRSEGRRALLREQYGFECACAAACGAGEAGARLELEAEALLCALCQGPALPVARPDAQTFRAKCGSCGGESEVGAAPLEGLRAADEVVQSTEAGPEERLAAAERVLAAPLHPLHHYAMRARDAVAADAARRAQPSTRAADFLRLNVALVERHFGGPWTVEAAEERLKLAQLLIATGTGDSGEVAELTRRCLQAFRAHFGEEEALRYAQLIDGSK